jgi:hypothetical protein
MQLYLIDVRTTSKTRHTCSFLRQDHIRNASTSRNALSFHEVYKLEGWQMQQTSE